MNSATLADVLILDMSTLTLTRDVRCGRVQLATSCGEVVGETTVQRTAKPAAAAFAAFEAALATGRVARRGAGGATAYHTIALLNPHTGQISTGPAGHGPVLNLPAGAHVGANGATGRLVASGDTVTLTLDGPDGTGRVATAARTTFDLGSIRAAHASADRCARTGSAHRVGA